jgi:hypothetical protein
MNDPIPAGENSWKSLQKSLRIDVHPQQCYPIADLGIGS